MLNRLRTIGRKLGLGRRYIRTYMLLYNIRRTGIKSWLEIHYKRRQYLSLIENARPLVTNRGSIEVHMLLHHKRLLEGMWGLYSLLHFAGMPLSLVIHNDGSLIAEDVEKLKQIFIGCRIISRPEADKVVNDYLDTHALFRCREIREKGHPNVLKLFDSIIFAKSDKVIIVDSDVLFYGKAEELLTENPSNNGKQEHTLYSVDYLRHYSLDYNKIKTVTGVNVVEKLNSGILRITPSAVDLNQIEAYLRHPDFKINQDEGRYFLEQTLWAIELSRLNAEPLPETYRICAPDTTHHTAGHYCGGGKTGGYFYTLGVPFLAKNFNLIP